jgi:hypothetical protein
MTVASSQQQRGQHLSPLMQEETFFLLITNGNDAKMKIFFWNICPTELLKTDSMLHGEDLQATSYSTGCNLY